MALRSFAKSMWKQIFLLGERFGVHIYPVHYYSQLPDTRDLRKRRAQWDRHTEMRGVALDAERRIACPQEVTQPYREEYERFDRYEQEVERFGWGGYGEIESWIYYCMIRHHKPRRIIEVGSGISALYALRAARANADPDGLKLTCVDPFPCGGLRNLAERGDVLLIDQIVQEVDLSLFESLDVNDILFIDSTHTVKIGGDVNHLVLEVLPRLHKGVLVHFHDIPWPKPCLDPFKNLMFWQESALLHAFLAFNSEFEILLCESYLHRCYPDVLRESMSIYDRDSHSPSSLWLRRVRE